MIRSKRAFKQKTVFIFSNAKRETTQSMKKNISELRKPEIVQALYKAIEIHGVKLPSFDQIANAGNMSRQLVRHYFSDSDEMAVMLCDTLASVYKDYLRSGIILVDETQRLNLFLDFYFGLLSDRGLPKPADDLVYDAVLAFAISNPTVRTNLKNQYILLQMTLAHEITISHPSLDHAKCNELGYLIVIAIVGHWKMVASLGFDTEYNRVTRNSLDRLIESYVNE